MESIFIPERFSHYMPEPERLPELIVMYTRGFALQGYCVDMSDDLVAEFFCGEREPVCSLIVTDSPEIDFNQVTRRAYFFAEDKPDVGCDWIDRVTIAEQKFEPIVDDMLNTLGTLSELSGFNMALHICAPNTIYYPIDNEDTLHIVLGGVPPGDVTHLNATHIAGALLDPAGQDVNVAGVTHGYGRLVRDEYECTVAQVIGSVLYLCLPTDTKYAHLLGKGGHLFRTVLQLAWQEFHLAEPQPDTAALLDEKKYVSARTSLGERYGEALNEELVRIDSQIDYHMSRVRKLYIERKLQVNIISGGLLGLSESAANSEWKRLQEHHLFDFIEKSTDGHLHLHTKDVCIPDGQGELRYIGRYIIRIKATKKVSIWSKILTHPKKIPHPHIGQTGSICFGNIDLEVSKLIAENRNGELFELILSWLSEGYDATLADVKIEEWPIVGDESSVIDVSQCFMQIPKSPNEGENK